MKKIILLFSILFSVITYSQGHETFDNLDLTGTAYAIGTFEGQDGSTWNYSECRGDLDLNGKAITLGRNRSNPIFVESGVIVGGMGTLEFSYKQSFSSNVNLEVLVNDNIVFTATTSGEQNVIKSSGPIIVDVDGDVVIKFSQKTNTAGQVTIDDVIWSSFDGGAINLPPNISQITVSPTNVTSSDEVSISAKITDADGISSATLAWGTESGDLSNSIAMTLGNDDIYTTSTSIPAQADGTTVYYQITAVDDSDENLTTTTDELNYNVLDPLSFDLPYDNGFRNPSAYNDAVTAGFVFENVNMESGAGGYLKMNANSYFETPVINFNNYDRVFVQFDIASHGGVSGQGIKVLVSNDNGANYTDLGSYLVEGAGTNYITYAQFVDLDGVNGSNGRLKFEIISGTGNNHLVRFRDFEMKEYEGYSYNGSWTPSNPVGVSTEDDNVFVYSGNAEITGELDLKNLYIGHDGIMSVQSVLNVKGDILNDGLIKFLSTENGEGELARLSSNAKVRGLAEVHRYMSAHRSFRMVSSSVTTEGSIHDNWQEGAESNVDNPNPGFGTHITGTLIDQDNGFDATISGNPSLFTLDIDAQDWVNIDNTDVNTLEAGTPYLLFVRGDRSIDLGSNVSVGETILRATGTLKTGNVNQTFEDVEANDFVMFGNPYQSAVNVNSLFAASEKVITGHYYVYDPTLGDHGNYATVDLTDGDGTNTVDSEANKYLQPGQAAMFQVSESGNAKVNFREDQKAPNNRTATNRAITGSDKLVVQLFTEENLNNGKKPHDAFGMLFGEDFSNEFTNTDALKYPSFHENIGINLDGNILSLERRAMPEVGEIFHIYSAGYENTQYVFKIMMDGLDGVQLVLFDSYTGTSTIIDSEVVYYSFEADPNSELSMAEDRFSIIVENHLGIDSNVFTGIQLYPNPITNDSFVILAPNLNGQEAMVSISDMLGRVVYEDVYNFSGTTNTVKVGQAMTSGIYLVRVSVGGEVHTFRVIKK